MNTRLIASLVGSSLLALCIASGASAQAPRTFVSASGSDKDTCTRTDPCRNFNRALSQTATGGEVVALDSATYEPFAVNKAVTVTAAPGAQVAITAASGDGIQVGAGPSDVVVLRGLDVESLGGAFAGILYSAGGELHVEGCVINGFGARGIDSFGPSLSVKDTIVRNSGFGILTSSGPGNTVTAEGVRLESNRAGLFATNGARVSIRNSVIAGNSQQGIVASGNGPGSFVEVNVEACMIAYNGTDGVDSDANGTAIVRISNSIVTDNGIGLHQAGTALLLSRGNNTVEGNKTADTQGTVGAYTPK
jgi:nitrous oxidase accessory protein NosD